MPVYEREPGEWVDVRWQYLARNLHKVGGPMIESDFNKLGEQGWEFVAVAKDYAIFKRRRTA